MDAGEYNGHRLYTGLRLDYGLRLWAPTCPTSASRAISAVAKLLVYNIDKCFSKSMG